MSRAKTKRKAPARAPSRSKRARADSHEHAHEHAHEGDEEFELTPYAAGYRMPASGSPPATWLAAARKERLARQVRWCRGFTELARMLTGTSGFG